VLGLNDVTRIALELLPAFDAIAAILVTLYISVAIFVAQNLFKQIPEFELSISGRSYVRLLSLIKISFMLIAMPILVRLGAIDLFEANYHSTKAIVILVILIALTAAIIYAIHGIITQKSLENKKTKIITSPSLKFVAWLIMNEPEWSVQRRDLMAGSLASTNKSSLQFEEFLFKELRSQTDDLTAAKRKNREDSDYVISLVNTLKDNWQNKPLGYPPYIDNLFQYLFNNWLKVTNDNDNEPYNSGGIYNLRLAFMNGFNSLANYCLKNGLAFDFFKNFREFAEGLNNEELQKFLLSFDETILFEEIPNSPEESFIWSDFYPEEWKFTYENLVEKKNKVALSLFHKFLEWGHNRMLNGEAVNKELDNVADNLFPDVDPIIWARILEFKFAPCVRDKHLAYVIGKTGNFGLGKSYKVQDWTDDEQARMQRLADEDEAQMKETVKLTNGIGLFNVKSLEDALKEVAELEKNRDLTDREKRKLAQHKVIFTRLKQDLDDNPKPKK
jgi:hypothetical protein